MTLGTGRSAPGVATRRVRDRALVVGLIGCAALLPPLVNVFALDARVLGVPVALAYLFLVWALLIIATAWLSRALSGDASHDERSHGHRD